MAMLESISLSQVSEWVFGRSNGQAGSIRTRFVAKSTSRLLISPYAN